MANIFERAKKERGQTDNIVFFSMSKAYDDTPLTPSVPLCVRA
jgi:hypothetical protein